MSIMSHNPPTDDARPIPPRYWWLKRIGLATGILIVGLVALRLWWGWEADRRLQAKIAEYRAAGQPVEPNDFKLPHLPNEENAAWYYRKAASLITQPPDSRVSVEDIYGELDDEAVWAKYECDVEHLLAANAEALRLAHAARPLSANWDVHRNVGGMPPIGDTSPQRSLAKLLVTAASYQHRRGNDAAVISALRDAEAHSRKLADYRGIMIMHLVGVATDCLATSAMESITPTLDVHSKHPDSKPGTAPASREQVEQLIASLLDEHFWVDNYRWALYGERAFAQRVVSWSPAWGAWGVPRTLNPAVVLSSPVPAPAFKLDALMRMDYYTAMIPKDYAQSYAAMSEDGPVYPAFESGIERRAHLLSEITLPGVGAFQRGLFQARAQRRLAATALAIRLYELDHERRPERLAQLVPDYLPEIPTDPYSSEESRLGYLPTAMPPLLYSVGEDGVDDGGSYETRPDGSLQWPNPDLVYFLNGDRSRIPSYLLDADLNDTRAVVDEGNEVRDGGEAEQNQTDGD